MRNKIWTFLKKFGSFEEKSKNFDKSEISPRAYEENFHRFNFNSDLEYWKSFPALGINQLSIRLFEKKNETKPKKKVILLQFEERWRLEVR